MFTHPHPPASLFKAPFFSQHAPGEGEGGGGGVFGGPWVTPTSSFPSEIFVRERKWLSDPLVLEDELRIIHFHFLFGPES